MVEIPPLRQSKNTDVSTILTARREYGWTDDELIKLEGQWVARDGDGVWNEGSVYYSMRTMRKEYPGIQFIGS